MEFSDVINLIRGPKGTEVRLTVIPVDNRFVKRKVIALMREPLQGGKLVGKKAPTVVLTGLADGGEKKLSDFSGKIVVLEFWTTTCAPCIVSVSAMQTYPEKHPAWGDHVALIALSLDERREAAEDFVRKKDWEGTYNAWGDEKVKRAFNADILPLVFVIDANGKIVAAGDPRIINVPKVVDGLLSP
jgi:peroxiredoxin